MPCGWSRSWPTTHTTFADIEIRSASLEDAFLALTSGEHAA